MRTTSRGNPIPRERWQKHRCIAPGCDALFYSTRGDQLTCSPRCRQRYKRHCDKITAQQPQDKQPVKVAAKKGAKKK